MKWIKPSRVDGKLTAPASKSMTLRATAAALLSEGESLLINPSFCDDALSGFDTAEALGAQIERKDTEIKIKGERSLNKNVLTCGESGLCIRMFTPIAALYKTKITLTGTGSLMTRPAGMMEKPLHQLGAYFKSNNGFPPITVQGPIRGAKIRIDGSISSQFLTGLLLALPLCPEDSEIFVDNLKSKPYVAMTLSILRAFGIFISTQKDFSHFLIKGQQHFQNTSYFVEGDWSGASFILVAGAINGKTTVNNLPQESFQADKRILEALKSSGAGISIQNDAVTVEKNHLKAFIFDATECPDLFPPLVALACCCTGRSLITGVERLKHKESDRAQALLSEFSKIGAKINIHGDRMEIEGTLLKGGVIDSHNDHRIAMAGAVAGLKARNGVHIDGWECVSKSYPCFFEDLKSIGGDTV